MPSLRKKYRPEDLDRMSRILSVVGLNEFVKENDKRLFSRTCNSQAFGLELLRQEIINKDKLKECMNPPGTVDKNAEFYGRIIEANNCSGYIKALNATENFGILNFINELLLASAPPAQVPCPPVKEETQSEDSRGPRGSFSVAPPLPTSLRYPITPKGLDVSVRLHAYLQFLKAAGINYPFYDFTQPYLMQLYESTVNYDRLIVLLKAFGVLDDYAAKKMMAKPDWNKLVLGEALYDIIKIKWETCIPALIKAFEESGNETMIDIFDQWLGLTN